MATYNSNEVNQPGQYPAPSFTKMGLPSQDEDSGAAGSGQFSTETDHTAGGITNEPGQYPSRMPFVGTALGGSGAPGGPGIHGGAADSGPDSITFTKDTTVKSQFIDGQMTEGMVSYDTGATVSGKGDWTQANAAGYQAPAQYQMPGTAQVSLDAGGDGAFQPGSGSVRRGGFMNGQR
jgi:hypothetical protein